MIPIEELERIAACSTDGTLTISRRLAESLVAAYTPGIDPDEHLADILLPTVDLTPIERSLLTSMRNAQGKAVKAVNLIQASGTEDNDSLWVHICRLRKKINPQVVDIQCVRGIGYQLEERIL